MATNLRLRRDAEEAVRLAAQQTGRSQQDIIREAVDRHLGLAGRRTETDELSRLVAAGVARPPRTAYRRAVRRLRLPAGLTSTDLLEREDRF